jgi:hypothetical protein
MKMRKFYIKTLLFSSLLLVGACESLDLDGIDNPNAIQAQDVDANHLLNSIQTSFSSFYYTVSSDTRGVTRMVNQFGSYASEADPQNTQSQWSSAASILMDVKVLKGFGETSDIPYHVGIAKILESYTYVTMVDFFGDVPYSQALQGPANLNPAVDPGADIYDAMLVNIDEAIALLSQPAPQNLPTTDFYYAGNYSKWIKLANSLKIKIYNNLRLTRDVSAEVNAIVASGNYMTSNADDFNFKYSNVNAPTDSRHPDYVAEYDGSPSFHLSNTYLKLLMADKPVVDPRRRYYFYRQTGAAPSGVNLPCATQPNIDICYIGAGTWGNGYWGRDHGDDTGIPNDAALRTVVGLYPAGGRFDNSRVQNASTSLALNNAQGAGILNILDYSFVQFMLAELALTETGVTGNAATLLDNAVNANITKVMGFRPDLQILTPANVNVVPTAAAVTAYKTEVTNRYATATTTDERLNIIIKEFYIASWGNGMEAYNMYRRTGFPANNPQFIGMQSPVTAAGSFVRSFFYPTNSINNNSSIVQHPIDKRVFWDNNPVGFID